ncbi:MAG: ATPase [Candidatus Parcubacteria bacterium]|jgi:chromosomal replication initiator protein
MNEPKKIWETALVELELAVSKANFSMWFKDTSIVRVDDGTVHLSVPNVFTKEWLTTKFYSLILKTLRGISEHVRSIEFIVVRPDVKKKEPEKEISVKNFGELPFQDLYINKEDNLNPRYTFDNFVVGPFNELAFAASQAVIKRPGITYNPLFLYGDTGRGKTHLIQAIGNHIKNSSTEKRVHYVTSEKFTLDYLNSLKENKTNYFKEKYRKYDVLIMDDIQFFSNTEKTQEELFHLFNTLYDNNKQIIFSSDKHPNFIPNLEDRLRSRFSAGMIIDVPQPDHESRVAILKTKSQIQNFPLTDEIINFLAASVTGNIRELEGVLNSVICQSQLKGKELNINEIKSLIKNSAKPKKTISPKEVIKIIADFYNIEEESIYEKTRKKEIIKPRQLIMYILREDFNISYPSIGQKLGGRDHTTVMHSCEKIKNEIKTNQSLEQEINQIRSMVL